jgi:hypothetical protein
MGVAWLTTPDRISSATPEKHFFEIVLWAVMKHFFRFMGDVHPVDPLRQFPAASHEFLPHGWVMSQDRLTGILE